MFIRCTLPEADNIEFFGQSKYHFKRNSNGDLVCDVQDPAAASHFLSKDIYEAYNADEAPDEAQEADDGVFSEVIAPPPGVVDLDKATHEELVELYRERFGKAAHPQMKYETLLAKLKE